MAIYLPALGWLDAGWARHFLRNGINHFNYGEYVYSLEELDNAVSHAPSPAVAAYARMYKARGFYALHNPSKARAEFEQVFRLAPDSALFYAIAGSAAFKAGQLDDAQSFFERGLKVGSGHDLLLNNFAWFRATCPDGRFRNGGQAVKFARQACDLAKWKDSAFLDSLAAAQAESGDFRAAAATQQRALSDKDAERLDRVEAEARLHSYLQGQPYRAKTG